MQISLDGRVCLLWALLLLTLPFPWLFSAFFAAGFHELCHLAALCLARVPVSGIRIGSSGTEILTPPLTQREELFAAAAGPLGSLFLTLWVRFFPRIALCAAIQGLFNLLPLFPLDGGRILRGFAFLLFPEEKAILISFIIEIALLIGVCILSFWFSLQFGLLPPLIAGMLVFKGLARKRPCKESKLAVQ